VDSIAAAAPARPYYTGGVSYAGEIPMRPARQYVDMSTEFQNRPA
jgi:hypothetical protein